jgi:DNA ligase-1
MKTKTFPELFQAASTGKLKRWVVWVEENNDKVVIREEHGLVNGKQIPETIEVNSGVNKGKSNETTPWEQAVSEAQSKWNKKKDKGYTEKNEEQNKDVILPMLAEKYAKRSKDIIFPAFVQPKLNGVRCVVHKDLRYQSRVGKFWNSLNHLDEDVKKIIESVSGELDGELYIHGLNLQDIGALVKKERINDEDEIEGYKTEDLEYWIFDQVTEDNFQPRFSELHAAFCMNGAKLDKTTLDDIAVLRLNKVVLVPVTPVYKIEEIDKLHKTFVSQDFEGTIIRNNTPYVKIHRTKNLQKKKDFLDEEFIIVGGKEATGRDKGSVVFRCKTKEGVEFDVRPMGSISQRKQYWKNIQTLVGKMLTCKFQEWTKSPSVPFHARGVNIRDYE